MAQVQHLARPDVLVSQTALARKVSLQSGLLPTIPTFRFPFVIDVVAATALTSSPQSLHHVLASGL
eukprot:4959160-Amphidinium_carterae.1